MTNQVKKYIVVIVVLAVASIIGLSSGILSSINNSKLGNPDALLQEKQESLSRCNAVEQQIQYYNDEIAKLEEKYKNVSSAYKDYIVSK